MRLLLVLLVVLWPLSAFAMVGGAPPVDDASARSVVTVIGSRGTFCSGALIAPDIVLSAAHCVQRGTDYKIVLYDARRQPHLRDVKRVATHPQFAMSAILAHRADVALLQLAEPILSKRQLVNWAE